MGHLLLASGGCEVCDRRLISHPFPDLDEGVFGATPLHVLHFMGENMLSCDATCFRTSLQPSLSLFCHRLRPRVASPSSTAFPTYWPCCRVWCFLGIDPIFGLTSRLANRTDRCQDCEPPKVQHFSGSMFETSVLAVCTGCTASTDFQY